MVAATATLPLLPNDPGIGRHGDVAHPGVWAHRLADGRFTRTVASAAGLGRGWIGILPFALLVCTAVVIAAVATGRLAVRRRDAEAAVVALAGWLVTLRAAPALLRHDRFAGGRLGAVAALLLLAAVVVTVVRVLDSGALAALPGLPLLALGVPALPRHPPLVLLAVSILTTAYAERRRLHLRLPRASDVPARVRS